MAFITITYLSQIELDQATERSPTSQVESTNVDKNAFIGFFFSCILIGVKSCFYLVPHLRQTTGSANIPAGHTKIQSEIKSLTDEDGFCLTKHHCHKNTIITTTMADYEYAVIRLIEQQLGLHKGGCIMCSSPSKLQAYKVLLYSQLQFLYESKTAFHTKGYTNTNLRIH